MLLTNFFPIVSLIVAVILAVVTFALFKSNELLKNKNKDILVLQENYNKQLTANTNLYQQINNFNKSESFDFEPKVSYVEKEYKSFYEYYDLHRRNEYASRVLRKIGKENPDLLIKFLNEFAAFDWKKVYEYMKKINWTYSSTEWNTEHPTPTIEHLQDAVITLIPFDGYDNRNCGMQSGGWTVSAYKNPAITKGNPFEVKIEFNINGFYC